MVIDSGPSTLIKTICLVRKIMLKLKVIFKIEIYMIK